MPFLEGVGGMLVTPRQAWLHIPLIPSLGKRMQTHLSEFRDSLVCVVSPR